MILSNEPVLYLPHLNEITWQSQQDSSESKGTCYTSLTTWAQSLKPMERQIERIESLRCSSYLQTPAKAPTHQHMSVHMRFMCVHERTRTTHKYWKIKTHGKMQQSVQIFAVPNTEAQGNLAVLTRLNCDPACNPLWVTANITLHLSRHTGVQRLQASSQSPCRPSKPSSHESLTYECQNWLYKSTMALARTRRMCSGTPQSLLAEHRTRSLFLEEYYYKCWSGSKVNSWNPTYCSVVKRE